jgi:hypothetical protein
VDGVLDAPRADVLVARVIEVCAREYPGVLVTSLVSRPGGQRIADRSTAKAGQMALTLQVREINNIAVSRGDLIGIPQDFVDRQPSAICATPAYVGAAVRLYSRTGTQSERLYQSVGVIGLLGIESEMAYKILTQVVKDNGFLIFSDLPTDGEQGRA